MLNVKGIDINDDESGGFDIRSSEHGNKKKKKGKCCWCSWLFVYSFSYQINYFSLMYFGCIFVNLFKCKKVAPHPGLEPGSTGWKPIILTT